MDKRSNTLTLRFFKQACLALGLSAGMMASALAYQGADMAGKFHHRGNISMEKVEKMALKRAKHLSRAVDANDAQRAQLEAIATTSAKQSQSLWSTLLKLREQRMQLLAAPRIDKAALTKVEQEVGVQQNALRKIMNQAMLDTSLILTPEQRAKLLHKIEKRRKGKRGEKHDSE